MFRDRQWKAAQQMFQACLDLRAQDGPSAYYIRLIDEMMASPPPPDWDGVSVMEHK